MQLRGNQVPRGEDADLGSTDQPLLRLTLDVHPSADGARCGPPL